VDTVERPAALEREDALFVFALQQYAIAQSCRQHRGIVQTGFCGNVIDAGRQDAPDVIFNELAHGKLAAAEAALSRIEEGTPLGIGSGSTVDVLVALIERQPGLVEGAVAASSNTEKRLKASGIEVLDLNLTGPLDLYIDGADEVDPGLWSVLAISPYRWK